MRGLVATLALAAAATGCSLIVDNDGNQCETDADCAARGKSFAGATCSKEKLCVGGAQPCQTNQECIDRNGGTPAICRHSDKTCAVLLSQDCQAIVPDDGVIADDDVIVFGFLGPLKAGADGDFSSIGIPIRQGVELALSEILTNKSGLPGGADGKPRPLAMVACHDLDDPIRAATHLVSTIQVPAIVGPAFSGVTITVANEVTIPGGVMTMSASATSPAVSDLDDHGLAWRTVPSDAIQAIPLAAGSVAGGDSLATHTEKLVRAELGLSPSDRVRVAMTVKGDAYGTGLANAITKTLKFNGKSVADNGNDFLTSQYADPSTQTVDYTSVVAEVVAFEPHIVMPMGTNESITEIIQGIESAWPTTAPVPPRPHYLCPDGGRLDEMLAAVKAATTLRGRVLGTVPGRKTPAYDAFKLRFKSQFKKDPGTYAENAYDAGYLLSYAALAGAAPLSGANMAAAMGKMVGGAAVDAGPDGITTAFNALAGGGKIDYVGASGPLNFDLAKGEAPADIDTWCVILDIDGNTVFTSTGQYYDAAANKLVGAIANCCKAAGTTCSSNNECCNNDCSGAPMTCQ